MPYLKAYDKNGKLLATGHDIQGEVGHVIIANLSPHTTYPTGSFFVSWQSDDWETEKVPVPEFTTLESSYKEITFYFKDHILVNGKSAYQVAVDNGFKGTESEWVASIKGEKGDKGDKGDKGEKGEPGTAYVDDYSITPEKTSFIEVSTNLVDKHNVIVGKNLDTSNGTLINSSVASVFEPYFNVEPGEVYTSSGLSSRVFYGNGKEYKSGTVGNGTFTIPDGVYYLRVSSTNVDNAQLNKGNTLLPYENYFTPYLKESVNINNIPRDIVDTGNIKDNAVTTDKVSFVERSKNLINKEKLTPKYAITAVSNGELVANNSQYATEFIKVTPNKSYTISTGSHRVAFYDRDKKYIGQTYSPDVDKYTFTSPSNAYYIRTNVYTTRANDPSMFEGTVLLPYEEWHEPILKGITVNTKSDTSTNVNTKNYILDNFLDLNYTPTKIEGISDSDPVPASKIKYTDYYTYYDNLMNNNTNYITKKLEGTDSSGKEIYSYRFKPEEADYTQNGNDITKPYKKPKIFLVSSTHGNERVVIWALYNFMKQICENWQNDEALEFMRWNVEIIVIPIINPSGYTNATRVNGNGVDLNRNFPSDWGNGTSDSTQTTYRGSKPLSENESIICDNILKTEKPDFVIDYHNFHEPPKSNYFNWIIGYNDNVNKVGSNVLSKMARKWKKTYTDLPQDSRQFGYLSPGIQVGSLTNHAQKSYGIPSALFEVCWRLDDKPNVIRRDSFICTIATDSLSNFVIQVVRNINKL